MIGTVVISWLLPPSQFVVMCIDRSPWLVGFTTVRECCSVFLTWLIRSNPNQVLSFSGCLQIFSRLQSKRQCVLLYENPHIEVSNKYKFGRGVMNFLLAGFASNGSVFRE